MQNSIQLERPTYPALGSGALFLDGDCPSKTEAARSKFVKEWIRCRTTSDERCGKSVRLCVFGGLVLTIMCTGLFSLKIAMAGVDWSSVAPRQQSSAAGLPVPHALSAYQADARSQAALKNYDASSKSYSLAEKSCSLDDPARPELLNEFGSVLLVSGRAKEALKYLEQSVNLDPSSAAAQNNLAICRRLVGESR